jgi:Flp pilus assembly protein TadG
MKIWRRQLVGWQRFRGQDGQSLIETAIGMPLLLGLAFNIINWGYLWFMVLALSAAPRMGVEYATQGGAAGTGSVSAPGVTAVQNLVWENLTNAVHGSTTATVGVQVCIGANGLLGTGNATHAACVSSGPTFPAAAPDPEAPVFVLHRVDVQYTVKPIIPGPAFNVILPANLTFHRQVSMRSLY